VKHNSEELNVTPVNTFIFKQLSVDGCEDDARILHYIPHMN